MSKYTIVADIAGQLTRTASARSYVTTAAVTLHASDEDFFRQSLGGLPKWRDTNRATSEALVELVSRTAAAAAIITTRMTPGVWEEFWDAAKPLHDAIVAQDKRAAGFIKGANAIKFALFGEAVTIANAHALKFGSRSGIVDHQNRELIDRTLIFDSEIEGLENVEVFRALWDAGDRRQPLIESMGFRFITRECRMQTEQNESLLLLADHLAGLGQASAIEDPGRIPFPLDQQAAESTLRRLQTTGRLKIIRTDFDLEYEEIFGEALRAAKANARV